MDARATERAHDRRAVEITYVAVSTVALFAVGGLAYKLLVARSDGDWQGVLTRIGPGAGVLVIALLSLRAVRLLRKLEIDLRPENPEA